MNLRVFTQIMVHNYYMVKYKKVSACSRLFNGPSVHFLAIQNISVNSNPVPVWKLYVKIWRAVLVKEFSMLILPEFIIFTKNCYKYFCPRIFTNASPQEFLQILLPNGWMCKFWLSYISMAETIFKSTICW